jgi:hypothetical protein
VCGAGFAREIGSEYSEGGFEPYVCESIHRGHAKTGENHTFEHSTFFVRTNINACGCKIGSFMSRNAIQHGRAAANDTVDGVLVAGIPLQQNSR